MSISLNSLNALQTNGTNNVNAQQANSLSKSIDNISSESSEEELKQVIKDFESYFVEQMLKEVKESISSDDEDSTASKYTDFFMDTAIEEIADKLVDETGETLTQQLYEQMRRNYNMD